LTGIIEKSASRRRGFFFGASSRRGLDDVTSLFLGSFVDLINGESLAPEHRHGFEAGQRLAIRER
jgi:hypothetical protein